MIELHPLNAVEQETWKKAVLADGTVAVGKDDTVDVFLYRRDQLLVVSEERVKVREFLENEGFDISLDPEDPGLGVRRLIVTGQGVLGALKLIAGNSDVPPGSVQLNAVMTGNIGQSQGGPVTLAVPAQPLLTRLQPTLATGAVVGVLDTGLVEAGGVVAHEFLAHRCNLESPSDADSPSIGYGLGLPYEAGHGTFVTGIILHMAPGARVVASRVLTSDGVTDDWTVARALKEMVARNSPNLHVVNLSLGGRTLENVAPLALSRAIKDAADQGVVLVASAENVSDGFNDTELSNRPFWPAAFEEVIGVAALQTKSGHPAPLGPNESLEVARYSAPNRTNRFAAVGDWVSTFGSGSEWSIGGGDYDGWARWEGTSFAAAAVTGAIAALGGAQRAPAGDSDPVGSEWMGPRTKEAAERLLEDALDGVPEIVSLATSTQVNWQSGGSSDLRRAQFAISPDVLLSPTTSHGAPLRGALIDLQTKAGYTAGRFGRMFPEAAVVAQVPASLEELAQLMVIGGKSGDDSIKDGAIPAGYAFLGQFIDHDLTFDPASASEMRRDPNAERNFRTPRFDLDSIYGRGPAEQPYLFEGGMGRPFWEGSKFLIGGAASGSEPGSDGAKIDLPRNKEGIALIADPRNDENVIISQLHRTMLQFHNRLVDVVEDPSYDRDRIGVPFLDAQRMVRWHYQWAVVHDFLPRIVGSCLMSDLMRYYRVPRGEGNGVKRARIALRFFDPGEQPFIPIEFSVGAYRFGHSLIRPSYYLNDAGTRSGKPTELFAAPSADKSLSDLRGFRWLPEAAEIDWGYFFPGAGAEDRLQYSLPIDEKLADPLAKLPPELGPGQSLAKRTLVRGSGNLPSGQSVAEWMGLEALDPDVLDPSGTLPKDLLYNTPLWYYILREAESQHGGRHLGEVGGRIVGEVMLRLLIADEDSYLRVDPDWVPLEVVGSPENFQMANIVNFASGRDPENSNEPLGLGTAAAG